MSIWQYYLWNIKLAVAGSHIVSWWIKESKILNTLFVLLKWYFYSVLHCKKRFMFASSFKKLIYFYIEWISHCMSLCVCRVTLWLCFAADSLFGTALTDQFAESDEVPAPPVLVRCTTELEKRLQETGVYWHYFLGVGKGIRPVKIDWWGVGVVICLERIQIVCMCSSWCHCHPKTRSLSLASFKSRLVLLFWYWLTQVVLEKRLLNGCSSFSSSS